MHLVCCSERETACFDAVDDIPISPVHLIGGTRIACKGVGDSKQKLW